MIDSTTKKRWEGWGGGGGGLSFCVRPGVGKTRGCKNISYEFNHQQRKQGGDVVENEGLFMGRKWELILHFDCYREKEKTRGGLGKMGGMKEERWSYWMLQYLKKHASLELVDGWEQKPERDSKCHACHESEIGILRKRKRDWRKQNDKTAKKRRNPRTKWWRGKPKQKMGKD